MVTRKARGNTVRGRVQDGTVSTVTIVAATAPATGNDLLRLPEGRRTNETRVIFTSTQLYVGGIGFAYEADTISIDGGAYEIMHVETWRDPSSRSVGYRCLAVNIT